MAAVLEVEEVTGLVIEVTFIIVTLAVDGTIMALVQAFESDITAAPAICH